MKPKLDNAPAGVFANLKVLTEPPGRDMLNSLTEDEVAHLEQFGVNSDTLLRSMIRFQKETKASTGKYPCPLCLAIAAKLGLLR